MSREEKKSVETRAYIVRMLAARRRSSWVSSAPDPTRNFAVPLSASSPTPPPRSLQAHIDSTQQRRCSHVTNHSKITSHFVYDTFYALHFCHIFSPCSTVPVRKLYHSRPTPFASTEWWHTVLTHKFTTISVVYYTYINVNIYWQHIIVNVSVRFYF